MSNVILTLTTKSGYSRNLNMNGKNNAVAKQRSPLPFKAGAHQSSSKSHLNPKNLLVRRLSFTNITPLNKDISNTEYCNLKDKVQGIRQREASPPRTGSCNPSQNGRRASSTHPTAPRASLYTTPAVRKIATSWSSCSFHVNGVSDHLPEEYWIGFFLYRRSFLLDPASGDA